MARRCRSAGRPGRCASRWRCRPSTAVHPSYVTVGHGDVAVAADALADALVGKPGVLGVDRYIIGPVVGAHTGPGTFGANYLTGAA